MGDHYYLREGDRCFFFGEYYGGESYRGGPTNNLICNFKIKPSQVAASPARNKYKVKAIRTISTVVRRVVSQENAEKFTWVPIPTSKLLNHPDHDDRLTITLQRAFQGYDVDVRKLLRQTRSTPSDHEQGADRLSFDELMEALEVDTNCSTAEPRRAIILFDDLITTGKHFKCCQARIGELFPNSQIIGIFAARRIFRNGQIATPEDFDVLS